jgi:hypothetical protein
MNAGRRLAMLYQDSLPANIVYYGDDLPEGEEKGRDPGGKTAKEKSGKDKLLAAKEKTGEKESKKPAGARPALPTPNPDGQSAAPAGARPASPTPNPDRQIAAPPDARPPAAANPGKKIAAPTERLPRQLRAAVVNCSGNPSGGEKMESLLRSNGVTVTEISDGNTQNSSSIISNTYDGWVLSKLAGLPFRYSLKLSRNSDAPVEAIVYVGKDFI